MFSLHSSYKLCQSFVSHIVLKILIALGHLEDVELLFFPAGTQFEEEYWAVFWIFVG